MRYSALLTILFVLAAGLFPRAWAATETTRPSGELQGIKQVEDFLNSITTMKARFTQSMAMHASLPGGTISEGTVYLKRPGQMKWAYELPSELDIYLDGNRVVYHDRELDQVTYGSLENLLASLIAKKNISFSDGTFEVKHYSKDEEGIRLTLRKPEGQEEEGPQQVTMSFLTPEGRMLLYAMDIQDVYGRTTRIEFSNAVYGAPIDEKVFQFKNPRLFNPKKRN